MLSITFSPAQIREHHRHTGGQCWRLASKRISPPLSSDPEQARTAEDILDEVLDAQFDDPRLSFPFQRRSRYFGTRFCREGDDVLGVYYASEQLETAVAEIAFHRLLAISQSEGLDLPTSLTFEGFRVEYMTEYGTDLLGPPFDQASDVWTHPDGYKCTQAFALLARQAGSEVIRYKSVRHPAVQANLAILQRSVIKSRRPNSEQPVEMNFRGAEGDECTGWVDVQFAGRTIRFSVDWFMAIDKRLAPLAQRNWPTERG